MTLPMRRRGSAPLRRSPACGEKRGPLWITGECFRSPETSCRAIGLATMQSQYEAGLCAGGEATDAAIAPVSASQADQPSDTGDLLAWPLTRYVPHRGWTTTRPKEACGLRRISAIVVGVISLAATAPAAAENRIPINVGGCLCGVRAHPPQVTFGVDGSVDLAGYVTGYRGYESPRGRLHWTTWGNGSPFAFA
jgi:hypothetical protein